MNKIRVYELAKEHGVTSKEMINVLKKLNYSITNHMSTVDDDFVKKVENYFNKLKSGSNSTEKTNEKISSTKKKTTENKSINNKNNQISSDKSNNKKTNTNNAKPNNTKTINQKKSNKQNSPSKQNKHQKGNKRNDNTQKEAAKDNNENSNLIKIIFSGSMNVGELAKALNKETSEIIKKLMTLGIMASINEEIELDAINLIADEYGAEVEEKIEIDETLFDLYAEEDNNEDLQERPAVVTIMGHVDHGKTTLLDAIRNSKVTAGEAGGITQHIGAYQIDINKKKITFLDTPGHAAFTTMRARGAQVTDITILVVAADDGVMPQTIEAISHAKAANVPIIVAVNKIDKPDANPDRVKQELSEHGLLAEDWGGETIFVPVSAIKHEGLDDLLEMLLLVAEVEELKANPDHLARGTIIEAKLDKGRGVVATVLVQNGTLRVGDPVVAGTTYGKIRAMINDRGKRVNQVGPSTPVEITGLNEMPFAGDQFVAFREERKARVIAEKRASKVREEELSVNARITLDDLYMQIQEGEIKELNVIIKGDVQGSVEALQGSLEKIDNDGVRVNIIHKGVGAITETDVTLASASNAIIIGFNVRPEPQARTSAEREKVDIRLHRIIYKVIEEIDAALKGLLDPDYEEVITGRAEVRQVFKASNIGVIAGSFVLDGKIIRNAQSRVIRDGIVVFDSQIETLKRFKDDVKEVAQGYECGITIEKFSDVKEGDIIESFIMQEVKK